MEANREAVVFGAGAVGGYLGARLAAAVPPWRITLIGRRATVEHVEREGIRVIDLEPELWVRPRAATSTENLDPTRLVILTVRGDDVDSALEPIDDILTPDGIVLAVQNGIGTDAALVRQFGGQRVIAGALTTSVVTESPGVIRRTSRAEGIGLASLDGSPIPEWLVAGLQSTGMRVRVVSDVLSLRWSKLLLNMIGAPLSAILDLDIRVIMENPDLFRIEQLAFREAVRVMDRLKVQTVDLPGYPVRLVRRVMRLPRPLAQWLLASRIAGARGGRSPGMRADMQRGRSEIESFHGAIASAGTAVGVATPVCLALATLVRALVADPPMRATFRERPDALLAWLQTQGIAV